MTASLALVLGVGPAMSMGQWRRPSNYMFTVSWEMVYRLCEYNLLTPSSSKMLKVNSLSPEPLFVPEEAPLAVHVFIETEGYVLSCPIQGHPAVNRVIWTTPNNTIVDTEVS